MIEYKARKILGGALQRMAIPSLPCPSNTHPCLFVPGTVGGVLGSECTGDRQERAGHVLASLHRNLLNIHFGLWAAEAQITPGTQLSWGDL